MPRKLDQIETEALKLSAKSRAILARKLLESLEPATETANCPHCSGVFSGLRFCPRDGSPLEAIRRSDLQIVHKP